MKKLLIATLFLAVIGSCKEDDPIVVISGSTAGITLKAQKNALLISGYDVTQQGSLLQARINAIAELEFKDRLDLISFTPKNAPFYNSMSDSLLNIIGPPFPAGNPFYFFLNGTQLTSASPLTITDDVEAELTGRPLASVGHVVYKDDSSWVVSSKVQFFDDTLVQPNTVRIETYMLADVDARVFGVQGLDWRFTQIQDQVLNTDSMSFWDFDQYNIDSSAKSITKGTGIEHLNLFMANSNAENEFGVPVADYWPFAGDFHDGDIIGTDATPIHHHFTKLESDEFDYDRRVKFLTVIWIFNPFTNIYDYVNSYSNGKTYKD